MLSRLLPRRHHRRLFQALQPAAAASARELHQRLLCSTAASSSPSLSIWRRKKEMGKEGLMAVAQLKRLAALPPTGGHQRMEQYMRLHVSRLLRTDLLAVLFELLRQDHVLLSMKVPLPPSISLLSFMFLLQIYLAYHSFILQYELSELYDLLTEELEI